MTNEKIIKKAIEKAVKGGLDKYDSDSRVFYSIIFSHDFAKAFFGKDWRKHLQRMVLKENPLAYLEKFLRVMCIRC